MRTSKKLALAAAFGLLCAAPAAHASVIYNLTLTPTSGGSIGGTGILTLNNAPVTTFNGVSNYAQVPNQPGEGTLESLSFTIGGQTFDLGNENPHGNAIAQFTSGVLDDITYAGTSNGFALATTSMYVFTLSDRRSQVIGSFTAELAPSLPAVVPEPASIALLGVAVAGLGIMRRRRSRAAA